MQWAQQISGQTARVYFGDRTLAFGAENTQNKTDGVQSLEADKAVVSKLLKELEEAQKTSKSQTVQDLRDKLNEVRKKLGEEKFKAIIEALKKDASDSWLAFLKALFPELFPDEASPSPAPPINNRGGGGGGGANPANYGSSESMSNKPFTSGAQYYNYKPDKSNPGKKPGMGREDGNIWSGFKQGPGGNCVTVSAIKASMLKFGQKPTDIFKDVKESGDGYDVLMRDGFPLHLSKNELQQAAQQARFEGDNPAMITDANFLYAASAKRAQMENNDGTAGASFMAAMQSLNDGEYANEGLDRLGLKNLYRRTTSDELGSGVLGVASDDKHSVAVIGGSMELWGGKGGRPNMPDAFAFK